MPGSGARGGEGGVALGAGACRQRGAGDKVGQWQQTGWNAKGGETVDREHGLGGGVAAQAVVYDQRQQVPPRARAQGAARTAKARLSAPPETAAARRGAGSNGPSGAMRLANSSGPMAASRTEAAGCGRAMPPLRRRANPCNAVRTRAVCLLPQHEPQASKLVRSGSGRRWAWAAIRTAALAAPNC